MQDWWAENSKERSAPGSYQAENFDLDLADIGERYAFYDQRFGIPTGGDPR